MATDKPDLHAIFNEAITLPCDEDRRRYVEQACGTDHELKARVQALLHAHSEAGDFFGGKADDPIATEGIPMDQRPGVLIGPYKLLEQIGEGGMGTVYMAEQSHPVERKVALKVIKAGMDTGQVIARFEAERQALALMDHPNIAKVLDAGTIRGEAHGLQPERLGRPYFVMELVKGVPITTYCDENHLSPKARLELFTQVCQAVQHAHQKGIIHRDIKPTNVLVTLYDDKPVPKVIDFGVAKAIGGRLTERTMFTGYGQIVGTLEYMSPEQARMNALDIDTRGDIYSLGVLLYELLTGTTPFDKKRLREAAFDEMLRMIREEEPPKPSTRLSTAEGRASIAANRGMEPGKLSGLVRGELDWIVMKALEKDRNRRYETANGFAMDVQRYLHDEAVLACPPAAMYRLRKLVRRNKGLLIASAIVAFALVTGTVLSAWQAIRATKAESRASELLTLERNARNAADVARQNEAEQRGIAEAARREEAKQRGAAQDNAAKAQKNYETARQAVQQMLTRVADEKLGAIPKMKEVRIQLLEDAAAFHAELLKMNPDDARAYSLRAYVYSLLPRYEQARTDYEKSLDLNPTDAECQHNLAWFLAMCPDVAYRDYPRALIHAKHAVELEPRNATYAYTLGITYRFLNDRKRALEELGRAIELNPASGTAYELRSHIYRDFGDYERALADALKAVELARTSPWVHKTLSDAYRNVGQGEKALTAANRALELNPTPNANTTFYFYEARGLAYRQLGNHAAAIADFKTAVELAPFRSWTYRERALSEFRLKLYEAALADIAKAVELNPDDNPFNLTEIPPEEAAVCPDESFRNGLLGLIDRNIERSQSSATAYRIRARFHAAGGKWAEAIADYSKIVELLPQGARGRNNLAWQLATCPEARFQDPPRAVELAKKATELTPQQGAYWNTLGAAYYRAGQWNESIAALEKSIELRRGGDSNDWFFLAMANWQLGEHAKAREWYDKAVQWMDKNQPTNKELRGFRAEADELMKN